MELATRKISVTIIGLAGVVMPSMLIVPSAIRRRRFKSRRNWMKRWDYMAPPLAQNLLASLVVKMDVKAA